jgi:hypothetical protein
MRIRITAAKLCSTNSIVPFKQLASSPDEASIHHLALDLWVVADHSEHLSSFPSQNFDFCGAGFNIHHKVKSTGFTRSASAGFFLRTLENKQCVKRTVSSAGSAAGGLPVLCDPREPTYFSRWLFSFHKSIARACVHILAWRLRTWRFDRVTGQTDLDNHRPCRQSIGQ